MQTVASTKVHLLQTTHRSLALRPAKKASRTVIVRAEEPRITREYREGDDEITQGSSTNTSAPKNSNSVYADELPPIRRAEISDAMKEKMRQEYYGLGGSPNKPMGGNYFLYIMGVIAFLAILSAALGYI